MARRDAVTDLLTWTCTPCGKVSYSTRKLARIAARRTSPGDRMRAYRCPHGDGYHFGHVPGIQIRRGVRMIPERGSR